MSSWPPPILQSLARRYKVSLEPWRSSGSTLVDLAYRVGAEELARLAAVARNRLSHNQIGGILSRSFGNERTLHIGVFDGLDANGVASSVLSGQYAAVLFLGFLIAAGELVVALWADGGFLPWIGNPLTRDRQGEPTFQAASGLEFLQSVADCGDTSDKEMLYRYARCATIADIIDGRIECPARWHCASLMVEDVLRFGWLHELGHIVLGHTAVSFISEVPAGSGRISATKLVSSDADKRVIELMADDFAARHLLAKSSRCGDNILLMRLIASALFGIIYHLAFLLKNEQLFPSHPPAWIRAHSLIFGGIGGTVLTSDPLRETYFGTLKYLTQCHVLYGEALGPLLSRDRDEIVRAYLTELDDETFRSPYLCNMQPWLQDSLDTEEVR